MLSIWPPLSPPCLCNVNGIMPQVVMLLHPVFCFVVSLMWFSIIEVICSPLTFQNVAWHRTSLTVPWVEIILVTAIVNLFYHVLECHSCINGLVSKISINQVSRHRMRLMHSSLFDQSLTIHFMHVEFNHSLWDKEITVVSNHLAYLVDWFGHARH